MKNLFAYDFVNNTIVASKSTLKKAGKVGTPEYKALMKMIKAQPTFSVVEKDIVINENKRTYKGLTNDVMKAYLENQPNKDDLLEEFEALRATGKYALTKQWFLDKYPKFKMTEGKKTYAKAKIRKATASVKKAKVMPLAPAACQ